MFKYLDTEKYSNIHKQCNCDREKREINVKNSQNSTIFDL